MKPMKLTAIALVAIALVLLTAGCTQPKTAEPQVTILYSSVGQMPQLLATDQIDGYIAWQPFVAVGDKSGIAKIVSYSQNLPPPGIWEDHSCDSLVARDDVLAANPELANVLSAILIEATNYTTNNPDRAAQISADWIFGNSDLKYGNITVKSLDVERASIPTITFTNDPSKEWLESNDQFIGALKNIGFITGKLNTSSTEQTRSLLYNFGPLEKGKAMLQTKTFVTPPDTTKMISIGYLMSDHDAPLFVAIKDWKYFQDNYGFALKPQTDASGKVEKADLIVNNQKVADVKLVKGETGAQLMTIMGSNTIDFAVAGTPPTISAIDKGTPIKILFPLHTEGSALVVSAKYPVSDWNSFIALVKQRSIEGNPVKIAVPQGSIQDVQLKYALKDSGVAVTETK